MNHAARFLTDAETICKQIPREKIELLADGLAQLRERGGRLFLLGVGVSAGNCSHAVNDFRKLCGIEAYSPIDNVSELTARVNDESWDMVFVNWLRGSRLTRNDMVFVLSVDGGSLEKNVSPILVRAVQYAKEVNAKVCGIVGRDGGYTAKVADACVIVPTVNTATITPHAEAFQSVVWHLMVSHPALRAVEMRWEATRAA